MKKRILFVINPISGGKRKQNFPHLVEKLLSKNDFTSKCCFSEYVGHTYKIALSAIENDETDIIIAVGGDGTINEVASAVAGTEKIMGIIPFGSGNGLARSLNIPLNDIKAIKRINNFNIKYIDGGKLNHRKFFNVAGLGFDAHISTVFALHHTRGFTGYIKTTLSHLINYKPQFYNIEIDGLFIDRKAFMLSIANSTQFGNNAHISPKAQLNDGLLDLCIIKPFPIYQFPLLGYQMFNKTADRSSYVEIISGKKIRIIRENPGAVHVDGEPLQMGNEINIDVLPLSLKILT